MKLFKEMKWDALLTGVLYVLLGIVALVLPLVFVLHTVLRNHFAVALHVAMFVVGTLFVTNIRVKKPRNSTLAVLVGVVALAILKIFHIF